MANFDEKFKKLLPIIRPKMNLIDANYFARFFDELEKEGNAEYIPLCAELFNTVGWRFLETMEKIPNKLFYNNESLTSIEIPNTITSIGTSAF